MYKYLPLVSLILFAACDQKNGAPGNEEGLAAFSADSMKQHIVVLASDSLMGR